MLTKSLNLWNSLLPYRAERLRCKNYAYGRQYLDTVTYRNRTMTEEEYIRSEGNVPLKNNLIRRILRNVLGTFRNNFSFPSSSSLRLDDSSAADLRILEMISQTFREENLKELYCHLMEEYLIGGMAVVKKSLMRGADTSDGAKPQVATSIVRPDSFFFNTDSTDPRGRDITAIGEIHTVSLDRAVSEFATSPDDIPRLRSLASESAADGTESSAALRIVELWQLEHRRRWLCHDRTTARAFYCEQKPAGADIDALWQSDTLWRYYFIAEDGSILRSGDSPLGGAGHPYVFKAYPFIDGEIHSFVADCIDQQRYINRLITLNDWILRASAKGVLVMPEGSLPDDVELRDITDQWARFNGVISYRHQDGVPAPHQVSNNAANVGVSDLLSVQLKMMEDVSGVNSALQGQLANGAVSGTLYEMQTRQALTGLSDIIESFECFMCDSTIKDIDIMRNFCIF